MPVSLIVIAVIFWYKTAVIFWYKTTSQVYFGQILTSMVIISSPISYSSSSLLLKFQSCKINANKLPTHQIILIINITMQQRFKPKKKSHATKIVSFNIRLCTCSQSWCWQRPPWSSRTQPQRPRCAFQSKLFKVRSSMTKIFRRFPNFLLPI